jgi:hypothetical protein
MLLRGTVMFRQCDARGLKADSSAFFPDPSGKSVHANYGMWHRKLYNSCEKNTQRRLMAKHQMQAQPRAE